ncbi:DUF2845 domain-containing protein [Hydrogenophaga sp.]|uniref:DUF2845 domain-containing protein n=1 Tax=Hydrogenophaga sp. TaxID=1904254 RepID=UPI002FC91329
MGAQIRMGVFAAVLLLQSLPAQAESLRCGGGTVEEGDSRVSLLQKCGPPQLRDSFCAPVFQNKSLVPVPEPFASDAVPCQQIDDWFYERGQGKLTATVRIRSGAVQSIRIQRQPR